MVVGRLAIILSAAIPLLLGQQLLAQTSLPASVQLVVPAQDARDKDNIAGLVAKLLQDAGLSVSLRKSVADLAFEYIHEVAPKDGSVLLISAESVLVREMRTDLALSGGVVPVVCLGVSPYVLAVKKGTNVHGLRDAVSKSEFRYGILEQPMAEAFYQAMAKQMTPKWDLVYGWSDEPTPKFLRQKSVDVVGVPLSNMIGKKSLAVDYEAIALAWATRHPRAKGLKTFMDSGYDFTFGQRLGVYAPPGTSGNVVKHLSAEITTGLRKETATVQQLAAWGVFADIRGAEECDDQLAVDAQIIAVAFGQINPFKAVRMFREGANVLLEFEVKERAQVAVAIYSATRGRRVHETEALDYVPDTTHRMGIGHHVRETGKYRIEVRGKSRFGSTWWTHRETYVVP